MKGIQHLIAMRKAGVKPDSVTINFCDYIAPKYKSEMRNLQLGYAPTRDYRPFVGLDVIVFSEAGHTAISGVIENLKKYAKTIAVMVCEYGEDIGFMWDKKNGERDFG